MSSVSHGVENFSLGYGIRASLMLFLCQLYCQSADIIATLWRMHTHLYLREQLLQKYKV